jgi:transposase
MNDQKGARLLLPALPPAHELIADRGYDSDGFRAALAERDITPCIPPTKSRKVPLPYDEVLYRQRHRIEVMFSRLKNWRRIAMRYDRCAHTFFSAITLAATLTFWLRG